MPPLYRVIDCILNTHPKIGHTFLNKVDLADAYMCIWVRLDDIPSVALLVPKATPDEEQLVGFHLSIPMGYVESAAFSAQPPRQSKTAHLTPSPCATPHLPTTWNT